MRVKTGVLTLVLAVVATACGGSDSGVTYDRAEAFEALEQGAVSYPVIITLDGNDSSLRTGMSATARIMVEELTNQLLIPNWLVRVDQTTGETYVYRQTPDGNERVNIRLGVRYEGVSQVLNGLEEGDVLVLIREQFNGFFGGQ